MDKLCYSVREACTIAGIGRDRLYEAIRADRLAAHKYGRKTLIRAADLAQFIGLLEPLRLRSREPLPLSAEWMRLRGCAK